MDSSSNSRPLVPSTRAPAFEATRRQRKIGRHDHIPGLDAFRNPIVRGVGPLVHHDHLDAHPLSARRGYRLATSATGTP